MTITEKKQLIELKDAGLGYKRIAAYPLRVIIPQTLRLLVDSVLNPRSPTIIRFIGHSICYADYAGRREQGYSNSSSGQLIYYPLYYTVNL